MPITAEIKQMPVDQKMALIEEIWDTLRHEEKEVESPSWHKEVLDERMALISSGKAKFISIQELKDAANEGS